MSSEWVFDVILSVAKEPERGCHPERSEGAGTRMSS
jgi:hypothetical protein